MRLLRIALFPVLVPVLFMIVTAQLLGCTKKSGIRTVDPKEAYGMLRNDFAVIVDVREENEITAGKGMIDGASWFPFTSKIEKNDPEWETWAESLPKDKAILVYCRSGRRSGLAAERLAAKGLRVANLGAFDDWVKAGLPTRNPEKEK